MIERHVNGGSDRGFRRCNNTTLKVQHSAVDTSVPETFVEVLGTGGVGMR